VLFGGEGVLLCYCCWGYFEIMENEGRYPRCGRVGDGWPAVLVYYCGVNPGLKSPL